MKESINSILDVFKYDVMQEVGNIGAGNAATALSQMVNARIEVSIPSVKVLSSDDISEALGGSEITAVGVSINLIEDLHGRMLQIVQKSFVEKLLNSFYNKSIEDLMELDEMDKSVISELGNITVAAYANAIAELAGLSINITPPQQFAGKVGEMIHMPKMKIDEFGKEVLFIDVNFYIGQEEFKENMILVLDMKSMETLFNSLGV